jgi:hypothetical protein
MKIASVSSLLIDRNYLAGKWYGFVDSQSGIDVYVIRVGTAHGSGDIMSSTVVTETDAINYFCCRLYF